jgi:hypothetical protein
MGIDPMNNIPIIIRILFAVTLFQHSTQQKGPKKYHIKGFSSRLFVSYEEKGGFKLTIYVNLCPLLSSMEPQLTPSFKVVVIASINRSFKKQQEPQ